LLAQNTPKVTLDSSESLFAVLASINACGYDHELASSDPLREQVRGEIARNMESSQEAKDASVAMCTVYHDHEQTDPAHLLSQFVSLALYLNGAPQFATKVKETGLPPDAVQVSAFLPVMRTFFEKAGLENIWQKHRAAYARLTEQYHDPVAKMVFDTEIYLKIPSSAYLGRQFTVYLDPMGAPSEINARQYGDDYYVVIAPSANLKMQQIRHTYLHYLLDPLAAKHASNIKRLTPLLAAVKGAPLEDSFKGDISLLTTECMVRAIEIRTVGAKIPEPDRAKMVDDAVLEGYVLTRYFYDAFVQFEKDPAGLQFAYVDMIEKIDVGKETKRASQIVFAKQASPELLRPSRPAQDTVLIAAEQHLSSGDREGAQKLAQQAIDENHPDQGRAWFILAQVAAGNKDMAGARTDFERVLAVGKQPQVIAWSHVYLGRIFDLQEDREAALTHYHAVLDASGSPPEARKAAERGVAQPYEPPGGSEPE
jgi:tetratricopeptide (TPR) repeat protein